MHGAPDTAPGLVQRLQESPQRLADSIRATALWLAIVDGPLDPREFHEVGLALTHEPEGVPLQDIAAGGALVMQLGGPLWALFAVIALGLSVVGGLTGLVVYKARWART